MMLPLLPAEEEGLCICCIDGREDGIVGVSVGLHDHDGSADGDALGEEGNWDGNKVGIAEGEVGWVEGDPDGAD